MKAKVDSTQLTAVDAKGRNYIFVPMPGLIEIGLVYYEAKGLQCGVCDLRIPHARTHGRHCKRSAEACLCDAFSRNDRRTGVRMLLERRHAYYRCHGEYLKNILEIRDRTVKAFPEADK